MSNYTEDAIGYMEDGGDIGGDRQVSAAPQRRFVKSLDDGTFALITVSAYVTKEDEESDVVDVQEQIEYMHCTDADEPGSSELYCDYTYDFPFANSPEDEDEGLRWAQNHVKSFNAGDFNWDGVTAIQF